MLGLYSSNGYDEVDYEELLLGIIEWSLSTQREWKLRVIHSKLSKIFIYKGHDLSKIGILNTNFICNMDDTGFQKKNRWHIHKVLPLKKGNIPIHLLVKITLSSHVTLTFLPIQFVQLCLALMKYKFFSSQKILIYWLQLIKTSLN